MLKLIRLVLACALAVGLSAPAVAHAQLPCQQGQLGGQLILICIPPNWNGVLVVYAHGYVAPQAPLALPLGELTLSDGTSVPAVLLSQGFAFATSSYSKNGYAVEQAGNDLNALVAHFKTRVAPFPVLGVLATGASEGGIITTMLVERFPGTYAGGLALCGPVGGMPFQIKYLGDFRVVFDAFFQEVFPFGAVDVPLDAFQDWETRYIPAIMRAIRTRPHKVQQLLDVTGAAVDPLDPTRSAVTTAVDVLAYSIFGTNDLIATAGGIPHDNQATQYQGSKNDVALNARVERVTGDPLGQLYISNFYQTTGALQRPLVTLHNTLDPVVPFAHEAIYSGLVTHAGSNAFLTTVPVVRYGHCNFTGPELVAAFALLAQQVLGP